MTSMTSKTLLIVGLFVAAMAVSACSGDPYSPLHFATTDELREHGCYAPSDMWPVCQLGSDTQ